MNRTFLAMGFGALLLSSAVGARGDFGSLAPDAGGSPAAVKTVRQPVVVAQADAAQAEPAAPEVPPPLPPMSQPSMSQPSISQPQMSQNLPPQQPQDIYMQDQAAVARINAQIDAIMQTPHGGFAVTYYAKPAPPPQPNGPPPSQFGRGPGDREPQPGEVKRDRYGNAEKYVVARAGDTVYATLDRAFSSDDPQAPIFVSIRDVDGSGIQGPLDGVRLIGKIKYSSEQASMVFEKGYLPDGRPLELQAIAISEDTARTGFAKDVDTHDIQRYGGLLLATLAQGAGQVGQILTQNNQQASVDPATGLLVASQRVSPYQAALGALLPAGQALTAVAAQQFNQPATITAPAGLGIGIVFLQPVALPNDVLFARAR